MDVISRACAVYCSGSLLHSVQMLQIFNDSKTFVDAPMRHDPEIILDLWQAVEDKTNRSAVADFVNQNFDEAGSDLLSWVPVDWSESPPFIAGIHDSEYREWASAINSYWKVLGRQLSPTALSTPERHSFLPRRYPMIVPGGRFRESYYWDSLWIVQGLLVSGMTTSAKYVIYNLLDDIENFGFVPNGGRIYYTDRSQPPLLSEMVMAYLNHVGWAQNAAGRDMLDRAVPLLRKEYSFWMDAEEGTHCVIIGGEKYHLNRYHSSAISPRPESYMEDVEAARAVETGAEVEGWPLYPHSESQRELYTEIRTGAETGWDFSSRFMRLDQEGGGYSTTNLHPTEVVPVELNSVMLRFELNMVRLTGEGGWKQRADRRQHAMDALMYNTKLHCWNDYNLTSSSPVSRGEGSASVSNYIPLWAGLGGSQSCETVVRSVKQSGLLGRGGVFTTTVESGQQWDYPNAWAPLVALLVEGLDARGSQCEEAIALATRLRQQWLRTCYEAWRETGYMYEKYNATAQGQGGGGGEYVPQVGFGWTNGVALSFLARERS